MLEKVGLGRPRSTRCRTAALRRRAAARRDRARAGARPAADPRRRADRRARHRHRGDASCACSTTSRPSTGRRPDHHHPRPRPSRPSPRGTTGSTRACCRRRGRLEASARRGRRPVALRAGARPPLRHAVDRRDAGCCRASSGRSSRPGPSCASTAARAAQPDRRRGRGRARSPAVVALGSHRRAVARASRPSSRGGRPASYVRLRPTPDGADRARRRRPSTTRSARRWRATTSPARAANSYTTRSVQLPRRPRRRAGAGRRRPDYGEMHRVAHGRGLAGSSTATTQRLAPAVVVNEALWEHARLAAGRVASDPRCCAGADSVDGVVVGVTAAQYAEDEARAVPPALGRPTTWRRSRQGAVRRDRRSTRCGCRRRSATS